MSYNYSKLNFMNYQYEDCSFSKTIEFNTSTQSKRVILSEDEIDNKKYTTYILSKISKKYAFITFKSTDFKIINFIESFNVTAKKSKFINSRVGDILCFIDDSPNSDGRKGVLITKDKIYYNLMFGTDERFIDEFEITESSSDATIFLGNSKKTSFSLQESQIKLDNRVFKLDNSPKNSNILKNFLSELLLLKKKGHQLKYSHPISKERVELKKRYLKILTFLTLDDIDKHIYAKDIIRLEEYFLSFGMKVKDFDDFIEKNRGLQLSKILEEFEQKLSDFKECLIYDLISISFLDGEIQKSEEFFFREFSKKLQIDTSIVDRYIEICRNIFLASEELKKSYSDMALLSKDKKMYELLNYNLISNVNEIYSKNEEKQKNI